MNFDARSPKKLPPSREIIRGWLQRYIAESIGASVEEIDTGLPFSYYGFDSMAALGISGELEIWLDRELPQTLTWDYPNIELLADLLAQG